MIPIIRLDTAKEKQIYLIFNAIAGRYDIVNTLASFGRHIYWRRFAVAKTGLKKGGAALDVCCGTGMITIDLARIAGPEGKVIGLDFSEKMLDMAERNLKRSRLKKQVQLIQGNAMNLPFADNVFDCAVTGYGLRNVPDLRKVLLEMKRVIKPGGRIVSLELAKPRLPVFKEIYALYLNLWIPFLGAVVTGEKQAYKYLHDSLAAYPHQDEVTAIYQELGFEDPRCYELTLGIAAVHVAGKPPAR